MRILTVCLCCIAVFVAGCGKRLSGRYETTPMIGPMKMQGLSAKQQRDFDKQMQAAARMAMMTLEFDGSEVRMGTAGVINVYKYRIDGNRLEVIAEGMGQKAIIPMTIESDGSITYMTMTFRRVQ
jgi:hypothetical protein